MRRKGQEIITIKGIRGLECDVLLGKRRMKGCVIAEGSEDQILAPQIIIMRFREVYARLGQAGDPAHPVPSRAVHASWSANTGLGRPHL